VGHLLACDQHWLLEERQFMERVRMVHAYDPGDPPGHAHRPLDGLAPAGRQALRRALAALAPGDPLVLEVFAWEGVARSAAALRAWCGQWGLA
jgi:hypothetical protein